MERKNSANNLEKLYIIILVKNHFKYKITLSIA